MTRSKTRSRAGRIALSIALALGLSAGGALVTSAPVSAASNGFIAVPNGMVGVPETITVYAPRAKGQVATIGVQIGGTSQTLQTTIGSNGYGAAVWTPTAAGTWVFNGLGVIASSGSASASVVPMPTYTVLMAQETVQNRVNSDLLAAVVAPIGNLAPTGVVTLQAAATGAPLAAGQLAGNFASNISYATLPWTPSSGGPVALQATYSPASGGQGASTSEVAQTSVQSGVVTVAVRWPTTLYTGTPTLLQAVTGTGVPGGSAAFVMDGSLYLGGSNPTVNGVATYQWNPPVSGLHTICASFAGGAPTNGVYPSNGRACQEVLIQPARPADNLTVDPPGKPSWSIATPIVMTAGSTVTLAGTSQSGTAVLFSEQGPCVISGAVLTALSPGQCQVTAISPGSSSIAPGSETYTITVTKPPKKKR